MSERVGEDWVGHLLPGNFVLSMPEIDLEIPLAEFYEGVEFPPPETADAAST
ncbi:MAG: hypothetical protein WCC64_07515 [Aliidongia sp.]